MTDRLFLRSVSTVYEPSTILTSLTIRTRNSEHKQRTKCTSVCKDRTKHGGICIFEPSKAFSSPMGQVCRVLASYKTSASAFAASQEPSLSTRQTARACDGDKGLKDLGPLDREQLPNMDDRNA